MRAYVAVFAALVAVMASSAHAVTAWNESTNGDLSNDRLNPTTLTLVNGSNTVTATSVGADREYVHISLGGKSLTQLVLTAYSSTDGTAFIAVQAGNQFTESPTSPDPANILGYAHFGTTPGNVGSDILPAMGTGAGSIGFTPPLSGSEYTFWIQQTNTSAPTTYTFDFVVVPEPASAALIGLCAAALLTARTRALARTGARD